MCESGFVWMIPERAPLLHGTVIVMVAAVVVTLISSLGLRKLADESLENISEDEKQKAFLRNYGKAFSVFPCPCRFHIGV